MNKLHDLSNVKEEGQHQNLNFIKERDYLEEKYLKIISESIKRERQHKKEVFQKYNAHALVSFRTKTEEEQKKMENEDISDRTPILDILIEKWKYFNKHKKQVLDKYTKNATALREAFEKIMSYLGVESLHDIPDLLEKIEDQTANISLFISNLTIESISLSDKKDFIISQIKSLKEQTSNKANSKENFVGTKKDKIDVLKKKINEFNVAIAEKEKFFNDLKYPTDKFLLEMDNSFLKEYVPNRIIINEDEFYNELNITSMLANIQDYLNVIDEVELISEIQNAKDAEAKVKLLQNQNNNNQINKELERLKYEMRNKIEHLSGKVSYNMYSSMKDKLNSSFDEAIKKMSEEVIKNTIAGGVKQQNTIANPKKQENKENKEDAKQKVNA